MSARPRCRCRGCPACLEYGQKLGCERRYRGAAEKCRTCFEMEREIGWPPVVFGRVQRTLTVANEADKEET